MKYFDDGKEEYENNFTENFEYACEKKTFIYFS